MRAALVSVRLVLALGAVAASSDPGSGREASASASVGLVLQITHTNPLSCSGLCDGTATVIVSGGTPPYWYSWSPTGGSSATASGLCKGTYVVTVTDNAGSQQTASTTLLQPPPLVSAGSETDATYAVSCNGSASVTPTRGTPPYAVSWSPGGSTATSLVNLCPGTYVATVTDDAGCTASYTANVGASEPSPVPTSFHTLTPCRLADTRGPAGPYGAPAVAANGTRLFDVPASSCGVPPTARAVALNLTVVAAGAAGSLVVTSADAVSTATSTLTFAAGKTRASNTIAGLSSAGVVAVTSTAPSPVDVVLDVCGYFE